MSAGAAPNIHLDHRMFDPFADDPWSTDDTPRIRVALRIRGGAIDRDFLTQLLGVAPSSSEDEDAESREWVYRLEGEPGAELGGAIESLLAVFPDDTTLWEELVDAYTVDAHCVVTLTAGEQSTAVDPGVLAALGRRGIPLSLELRAPAAGGDDGR